MSALQGIIVGGGLGGLGAAIALRTKGIDVRVYEQAPEPKEIGAGVGLGPNASGLLMNAGLTALKDISVYSEPTKMFTWTGQTITAKRGIGANNYMCHRADLLKILHDLQPPGSVYLGHHFMELTQDDSKVRLKFRNGATAEADFVIGADGIHSAVQPFVTPPSPPQSEKVTAYRALIPIEQLSWAKGVNHPTQWLGPNRSFLCFPVSRGREMNMVAFVPTDEDDRESWSAKGEVSNLAKEFEGWAAPVGETIGTLKSTFYTGIYDRAPLPNWSKGRVTLLGDAAHAMVPHVGQGATQAVEDGFFLATLLADASSTDIARLFQIYEKARLPRLTRVQAMARTAGQMYRKHRAAGEPGRDDTLTELVTNTDWLYGYDAEAAAREALRG